MSAIELTTAPVSHAATAEVEWGRRLRHIGTWLAIYGLVYTLSIGPMFWWWYEATFLDGNRWIAVFYLPLLTLCDRIEWFGNLVNWYINLWIL